MASDPSARPSGRGRTGTAPSSRGALPPGGLSGRRARAVRLATAALLALASLMPGAASAAQGLNVTTPYPAVAVAPGTEVSFDISVATAAAGRVNLAVQAVPQGWTATLRGGGFVIDGVHTNGDDAAEVTLDVDVPADANGTQEIVVRASQGGLTTDLPLSLRIQSDAGGDLTLTTDFPSLRGPSDVTFPFNLTLNNDTPEEGTYVVEAQVEGNPPGWEAVAKVSGQDQAASALVEAGGNVGIQVEVTPPENVSAGTFPVTVTATGGGKTATAELQVEITGSYALTLATPDGRLNASGSAGSPIRQTFVLTNTGTAPLEGVTLSQQVPTNWKVEYEPSEIPTIQPGAEAAVSVTAIITPSGDAIAGDYSVTITASSDQADAEQALRVTVETSLLWGLIGVALIVAVLAGLWFVFQRYGRR